MTTTTSWRCAAAAFTFAVTSLALADKNRPNVQLMKASDVIGMNVQNPAGEKLGSINNLAIQSNSGHCRFVILSHGGALGVGDTLHAIPFKACKFAQGNDFCTLDLTEQRLKDAPPFDDKGWSTVGDERWGTTVYTYYNVKPDFKVEKTTVKVETHVATPPAFLKGSDVVGLDLHNRNDEDLGEVEDLMIDVNSGRCAYAVIAYGGVAGIGEKLFAVPWQALSYDAQDTKFVIDINKDKLKNAPGFDKKNWPDTNDLNWSKDVHTFYGSDPNWVYGYQGGANAKTSGGWGPNDQYNKMFNDDNVDTFKCAITTIGSVKPMDGMEAGTELTCRTDKGETLSVHCCPTWFMERQDRQFANGEQIEVTGCRVDLNGKPCIMATQIKRGNETLMLRDKNGHPAWAAWHAED